MGANDVQHIAGTRIMKKLALLAVLVGLAAAPAHAQVGTQGFDDPGTPTADGSPTGDINTATDFKIGDLQSTLSQTGFFLNGPPGEMAVQDFGATIL